MAASSWVSSAGSGAAPTDEDIILSVSDGISNQNPPTSGPQAAGERYELIPRPARRLPRHPVDHVPVGGPAAARPARVVGPGRLERHYITRIDNLQRTVETAELVERGSSRLLDRVECDLERGRAALSAERQQKNRLLVGIGALQRENESLRAQVLQLEQGRSRPTALPAARTGRHRRRDSRPGFWARVLGSFLRSR